MNIFEQAVRQQLRFDINGSISIEQLYNANPTPSFISQVEKYEETLLQEQESLGKPTRRQAQKTERRKLIELKLAVVSSFLDEQEALRESAKNEAEIKAKEQELLELISSKQKEKTASKSLEELQAELAALRK